MAAGEEADEGIMRSRPAAACWLSKASRWRIEGIGGHQRQLECSLQGKWGDSTTEDRGQYRSGQEEREKVVEPSLSWI